MSAAPIDIDFGVNTPSIAAPAHRRSDGMVRVQVVPLVRDNGYLTDEPIAPAAPLISQRLIVDYLAALAQHAVKAIRNGTITRVDDSHIHPADVSCLRCAVIGSTHMRTLGVTLLDILAANNTDEEWNNSGGVSDTQLISRLRRLAVSEADLENLYGPHWAQVMVTGLRAEASDLEMVDCLTRDNNDVLWISDLIEDPVKTRHALAAYHLGTIVCPLESNRNDVSIDLKRGRIAHRFAVAMAKVAGGEAVSWMDHLPAPPL